MSNLDTTITIKKSIKVKLRDCKEHPRDTWDDIMLRLIKIYKEFKVKNKRNSIKRIDVSGG